MTLAELRALLDSGEFHHATYRDFGTLWEGLHVYVKEDNGFNGFTGMGKGGCFYKDSPDLKAAEEMVRHTGISVGAFGRG